MKTSQILSFLVIMSMALTASADHEQVQANQSTKQSANQSSKASSKSKVDGLVMKPLEELLGADYETEIENKIPEVTLTEIEGDVTEVNQGAEGNGNQAKISGTTIKSGNKTIVVNVANAGSVNLTEKNERDQIRIGGIQKRFGGYLESCHSVYTELVNQKVFAALEFQSGRKERALNRLVQALYSAKEKLETGRVSPEPYTLRSIRYSLAIAKRVIRSSQEVVADDSMPYETALSVQYLSLENLYNVVGYAFKVLDSNYYVRNAQTLDEWDVLDDIELGGNMSNYDWNDRGSVFGPNYFDSLRKLAVKFLKFQENSGNGQGHDWVKLNSAYVSVIVAKALLLESPYSRDFCPVIAGLEILKRQIRFYLDDSIPLRKGVQYTRRGIERMISALEAATLGNNCGGDRINPDPQQVPQGPRSGHPGGRRP